MAFSTNAILLHQRLDAQVGHPYIWGTADCSELVTDVMGPEGFGVVRSRLTADGFYHISSRIGTPGLVGDCFVELDPGTNHAHHIGMFYGPDDAGVLWTVEARGVAYGTPKYRLDDPKNGANHRHVIWIRLNNCALGEFYAPAPPVVLATPRVPGNIVVHRTLRANGEHFLTIRGDEALRAGRYEGYAFEFDPKTATVPVMRLHNEQTDRHFYTLDPGEQSNLANRLGYVPEGTAFGADPNGKTPVLRWTSPAPASQRLWTADPAERPSGWKNDGTAWRV
jgi:hypothetical protein